MVKENTIETCKESEKIDMNELIKEKRAFIKATFSARELCSIFGIRAKARKEIPVVAKYGVERYTKEDILNYYWQGSLILYNKNNQSSFIDASSNDKEKILRMINKKLDEATR